MRQFESFAIRHVDNVLSVLDQTQLPDVEAWLVANSPDDMVCASLEHGLTGTAQWRGRRVGDGSGTGGTAEAHSVGEQKGGRRPAASCSLPPRRRAFF